MHGRSRLLITLAALSCLTSGARSAEVDAELNALPEMIQAALRSDPQIRGSKALLTATHAQGKQIRSRWWPSVGLSAQLGDGQANELGRDIDRHTERTEAYVRVNVYNGGADQALLSASQRELKASQLDLTRTMQDITERVAQAYFELQHQQQLLAQASARLEQVRQLTENVARLVEYGKSAPSDSDTALASLADAQAAYASTEIEADLASRRLAILVGAPVGQLTPFELPPLDPAVAATTTATELARANNPARQAAQERAASARIKLGPIQPELLPKVDLEWRQALSDRTKPTPTTSQQKGWSMNVTYDMPLGGASFARREEGIARAVAAESETERVSQTMELELEDTVQNIKRTTQVDPIYQRQLKHLESIVRAGNIQYEAGRRTLIDLIAQQDAPFIVQQKISDNEFKRQTSALHYWSLTGQLLNILGVQ
jgi:outer membrane protein TolC